MIDLCAASEIKEGETKGLIIGEGMERLGLCLLRKAGKVYAYVNSCPHTGGPLNWEGDRFLDLSKTRLLCATHGALFRIEDGLCLYGPCQGKSLKALAVAERSGRLWLEGSPGP